MCYSYLDIKFKESLIARSYIRIFKILILDENNAIKKIIERK